MRFTTFLIAISLFLFARSAAADPVGRVVVVEIAGDAGDPDALRAALGDELRATAVAPDDPRAGSARGTLTIQARAEDRRITATYRSLGAPVERTVDLPEDPARARSIAVLLAGNVAREEASELLDAMKKPPAEPAPAQATSAAEDVRRLHAIFDDLGSRATTSRKWTGGVTLAAGAALVGTSVYYMTREGERFENTRSAGVIVLTSTAPLVIGGIFSLVSPSHPYEKLQLELAKAERSNPDAAVAAVEAEWARLADEARRRRAWAWIPTVIGIAGIGVGAIMPALVPPRQQDGGLVVVSGMSILLGSGLAVFGLQSLVEKSEIETAYDVYRAMKSVPARTSASKPRPMVGVAPLQGGGMLSLGLSF